MDLNKVKNEKGITLIALAVTIVVLLILAGVTISSVFSENGIIKKAQEAENAIEKAKYNDLSEIAKLEEEMEKYTSSNDVAGVDLSEYATFSVQSYVGRLARQKCDYMRMYVEISDVENESDKITYAIGTDWKENIVKENDNETKLYLKNNSTLEMIRVKEHDPLYSEENGTMSIGLTSGFTDVKISNLYLKKGKNYNVKISITTAFQDSANSYAVTAKMLDIYDNETGTIEEDLDLNIEKSSIKQFGLLYDVDGSDSISGSDEIGLQNLISSPKDEEVLTYTLNGKASDTYYTQSCLLLIDDYGNLVSDSAIPYIGFDYNRDGRIDHNDVLMISDQLNNKW